MRRWLPWLGFAVLSALLVGSMWVVPYLPTNDGPEWVFATHAENHYADAGSPYPAVYAPALQFASRGFAAVYGPLESWLGWEKGLQAALSIVVLLGAWSFVLLVSSIDRRRWALGFLGFPLALSWELYMGLWAFVVSTAVGLVVVALAVRAPDPGPRLRALLAFALLVNAVAHVFGAVLTGGCLLLLFVARARPGGRMVAVLRVTALGLPAAAVLALTVALSQKLPETSLARGLDRLPWRDAAAILPRTLDPGPLLRASLAVVVVLAAVVVAAVRAPRRDTSPVDRALGVAAVLLALLGVFAPFQIPGWQAFSQRFVPLAASLALVVMPLERLGQRVARFAPPALFGVAALSLALTYPFHRRLAALCPDAVAGLSAPVRVVGSLFPVTIRNTELPVYDRIHAEVPMMLPLVHMGTLYAAVHGGISPLSFASGPAVYPFVVRPAPSHRPLPDVEHFLRAIASPEYHGAAAYRREVDGELASFAMFYDEAAVFGALPIDLALWRQRGFVADWQGESTLLAHFEPCTIDFTVPARASDPPPSFDLGVGPMQLVTGARPAAVVDAQGLAHFTLSPAPCGVVTVRPSWPAAPGEEPRRCANAAADGELVATVSRSRKGVSCDLQ